MISFVALRDGGRIAYETRGKQRDPSILLLRPLGGSMTSWSIFADALAEHLRVVSFDVRGVGRSSAAPWSATTRTMASDAREVLDAIGISRAHVYGISLGGMVATWLAIDSPARVARLALASTLPKGTMLRRRGALAALSLLASAHPSSPRSLAVLLSAAARHDALGELARIEADTLVLAGQRDRMLGRTSQDALVERIPRSRLVIVPGAGHDVSAESPERVARLVIAHVLET